VKDMQKRKLIFIIVLLVCVSTILGVLYFNKVYKSSYVLNIPSEGNVYNISLEQSGKRTQVNEQDKINDIINIVGGVKRTTTNESVQDSPINVENEIKIDFEYDENKTSTLFVYKKKDNFWDDANPEGINKVILSKRDIYLDLSNPVDYIKYKILLANKNLVAPSMQAYEDMPKATYKYVLLEEDAEVKQANTRTSIKMECYKEFGKIEDDVDTMRFIIEVMEKRPYASDTKIEFLKSKIDELITTNAKMFLTIAKDEMLPTKILIKKSVENGVIVMRGNQYYLRDGSLPLCGNNEEPTLNIAARFLNLPKNQSIKLMLEAKLTD